MKFIRALLGLDRRHRHDWEYDHRITGTGWRIVTCRTCSEWDIW